MKVYNKSTQLVEKAKIETCPRCKGFGANAKDEGDCYLCHGDGRLWVAESGWTRAKCARMTKSQLY